MTIDLRSDTVTKPTPGMLDAMMAAPVGDDVFGEDPSILELEKKCATMLGMGAAVFCPSGTMTNQIGIKILTQPYEEIICYKGAHIYKYEGGGLAGNSLISTRLVDGDRGRLYVQDVESNINNYQDTHQAKTTVVALENTVVREGGSYYNLEEVKKISDFSRSKGLGMHLDGARLFNALSVTRDRVQDYGRYFDTISICLSKGLGAPVGSVLLCSKENELKARRIRKVYGGGMRQAGFLAAAASYALDNHIDRLEEDHKRAKLLGEASSRLAWVKEVKSVDTNIVIVETQPSVTPESVLEKMSEKNMKALKFGPQEIRMVTHLDFDDKMLERTIEGLKKLSI